jgi:hypothetical protein
MTSLDAVLELENRAVGVHGEPTLGAALEVALDAWPGEKLDYIASENLRAADAMVVVLSTNSSTTSASRASGRTR